MTTNNSHSWLAATLYFTVLALLIVLGWWQLMRGFEKADIDARSAASGEQIAIISAPPEDWRTLEYAMLELPGKWRQERILLLQNRLHQGRPGYEVIVPFELLSGAIMLVNRGWVAMPSTDHKKLPEITQVSTDSAVVGQLYLPTRGFTLGATYHGEVSWPLPILYYDFDALSQLLGTELAPAVLVLAQQHPDSFVTIWRPSAITPARHYAYAAQWWGLAITLIIYGFIWGRKIANQSTHIDA